MGLSGNSTGFGVWKANLPTKGNRKRKKPQKIQTVEKRIAIAGNPNVGKSTLFNELTGLHQHTGNWTGKTISNAWGYYRGNASSYVFVDIPGTYSLLAHSAEEAVARNFLCFGKIDACMVVCDATCLERGLSLLLQIMEIVPKVMLCVNLMDEAERKHIYVELNALREKLEIPVIGISARKRDCRELVLQGLEELLGENESSASKPENSQSVSSTPTGSDTAVITYAPAIEKMMASLLPLVRPIVNHRLPARWFCLQLLLGDTSLLEETGHYLAENKSLSSQTLKEIKHMSDSLLQAAGFTSETLADSIVFSLADRAAQICQDAVSRNRSNNSLKDTAICGHETCPLRNTCSCGQSSSLRKNTVPYGHSASPCGNASLSSRAIPPEQRIDRLLTSRLLGYPLMALLLLVIFWLTIVGANYPSQLLTSLFAWVESRLARGAEALGLAPWLRELLVSGIFRTVAWIVSVMLPPMAIFFPLFSLLEDVGYLPRIAYNLDYCFKKCRSCGKQALTMAMGFGCNAAGVMGCRIIDSPRERLIAILTNSFVPCNGRFPTLIAMISLFFIGGAGGALELGSSLLAACCLTCFILLGILMTFLFSGLLSATALRGLPSSFVLELPPFRKPRVGQVLLRSLIDRTLFVLSRAVLAALPAGLCIWLMANLHLGKESLLNLCAGFLDPLARPLGLDGTILMAFLLGLPANEIVLPLVFMAYSGAGSLQELAGFETMKEILITHGWDWTTAVSVCLFSLMHWPCATTLLTIHKETRSVKWTLLSILAPLSAGILCCMLFHAVAGRQP